MSLPLPVWLPGVQLSSRSNYAGGTFAWLVRSSILQVDETVNKEQQDLTKFVMRVSPTATKGQQDNASKDFRKDRKIVLDQISAAAKKKAEADEKKSAAAAAAAAATAASKNKGVTAAVMKFDDLKSYLEFVKSAEAVSQAVLNTGCVEGAGWDVAALQVMLSPGASSQSTFDACKANCTGTLTVDIVRYLKWVWKLKPVPETAAALKEYVMKKAQGEEEGEAAGKQVVTLWNNAVRHYAWFVQVKVKADAEEAAAGPKSPSP